MWAVLEVMFVTVTLIGALTSPVKFKNIDGLGSVVTAFSSAKITELNINK